MPTPSLPRRDFVAGVAAAALFSARRQAGWALPDVADFILYNGQVHTVDPRDTVAEAIAVGGGKVMAVGPTDLVRKLGGRRTTAIDLRGRTVLPGINDSHLHLAYWGMSRPPLTLDVGYPTVKSIADVAETVRKAVAGRTPGEWIQGRGWDRPYFAEGRAPTRADLDRVAPDNPVLLTEFSGHAVWVNTRALEAAGITAATDAPEGGVIVKDARGEPTGVLFEGAAGLVRRVVPPPSLAERVRAVEAGIASMQALGITSATEPGLDQGTIDLYAEKAARGTLGCRVTVLVQGGRSLDAVRAAIAANRPRPGLDPRRLRVAGIKFYADGIPTNNKTAWLYQPYEGGGNAPMVVRGDTDEERVAELAAMIAAAHRAGLQVGTHATGDQAIDAVVNGYLAAMAQTPRPDPRHYVIHADLVSPATLARMAGAGIGANFNPAIKYLIADGQRSSIGPVRAAYEWPFRTALDAGVRVASGSDAPVTDGNWRQGLATCVLREGKQSGHVSGPDQRITLSEAIRSHTLTGAWQDFAEGWKGSLERGKVADLCVLDGPLDRIDPHAIPTLPVDLTMVDGEVVFGTK